MIIRKISDQKLKVMSSNIRIVKTCGFCKNEFIAKTTVTQCCSDACAKRFYKLKKRNSKIAQAELKSEFKREPKAYITEIEIEAVRAKEYLSLKEAAFLLNITPLTLRRWILAGKVFSKKIGKKHHINRSAIGTRS
jgi:excisionase family DNA binding protein